MMPIQSGRPCAALSGPRPAARPPAAYAATAAAYAAGFLPLPLSVVGYLIYAAATNVELGSTRLFWVLLVAVPGALILGPLNVRHALGTSVDSLPGQTAKASAMYGLLGLFLLVFPFGLLVQFGWVGIVADVATVSVTVPLLARSRVLANAETERRAARLRLQQALR